VRAARHRRFAPSAKSDYEFLSKNSSASYRIPEFDVRKHCQEKAISLVSCGRRLVPKGQLGCVEAASPQSLSSQAIYPDVLAHI
jgi:hypothetical protein